MSTNREDVITGCYDSSFACLGMLQSRELGLHLGYGGSCCFHRLSAIRHQSSVTINVLLHFVTMTSYPYNVRLLTLYYVTMYVLRLEKGVLSRF